MKREDDSLMTPALESLLERITQKYELVLAATRRAKQIIREQRLNPLAIPEEERKRKPLSIALVDIAEGRVDQQSLAEPDLEFDALEDLDEELFADIGEEQQEGAADFPQPDIGSLQPEPESEPEPDQEEFDWLRDDDDE